MIILKQDFFSNFTGSIRSKDSHLTKDLLLNEISDIIAYDEKNLISLLNKVGISTKENTSDEKLVSILIDNIANNEKLQKGIAFMVADNHDLMRIKILNKKSGKKEPASKETYIAIIDKIYDGMKPTISEINRDAETKKQLKLQITEAVKNKVKTSGIVKEGNGFKMTKKMWWILGGSTVALVGGFLLYKYVIKPKMLAKKMGTGGAVPTPVAPTPIPVPPPQAMPQPIPIPVPSVAVSTPASS